ncbi:hypothetical protein C0Q70_18203 [Pomacea canaliculata]|uniref:G-protein coupled receptors family 1 profile domain-containing protein n=1 Tax=Pomacea canaliculata TaxID=400727 RepID=A0A2T7NML0_POMCA|nr:hypothetical protein C0Q70_18203 [Pomacea canaliculata]
MPYTPPHPMGNLARPMAVIPTEGAISAALYFTTALSTVSSTDDEVSNFSTDCIQVMHQDYPDDPISTEVERLLGKIREAIVMPILFVTGVMGSVVSLVAFYRQNLNNRINLCLFSLELVNLINISFLFILNFDSLYRPFDEGDTGVVGTFMTNSKMLGMLGFMYGAMYLSAVVSCERIIHLFEPEVRFAGRYNNSYFLLINIAETGSILNSSIDFFVYYSAGTKFRDTVHEMFPCLDRKSSHP